MTWRHHIERSVSKALLIYMRTYSLFKSEHFSTNIKVTLYMAQIRSPTGVCAVGCSPLETAVPAELSSSCCWQLWLAHTGLQNVCGFQNFLHV
jgi:hypothetical protein